MSIIAVTGAAGFIGSHVCALLLRRGDAVHACVRSLAQLHAWSHLLELPGAGTPSTRADGTIVAGALTLYESDCCGADTAAAEASLSAPLAGVRALVHCASPYDLSAAEQDAPAIAGTRAALRAAAATRGLRKVVITSSAAAVYVSSRPADTVYTDDDYSEELALAAPGFAYHAAKTRAELVAWALVEEGGEAALMRDAAGEPRLTLATLCPTQTIGPLLGRRYNTSSALLGAFADGSKRTIPRKGKCLVDVRDVAEAHVFAIDSVPPPSPARERYLLIAGSIPWPSICDSLRKALPGAPVPTVVDDGPPAMPQAYASCRGAWRLGVRFRPLEESIEDAARSMVAAGHLPAASLIAPSA